MYLWFGFKHGVISACFAGIGLLNFDFYWLASRSIFLFSA
ncbi:hypothetical protein O979_08265 [Mycobacterium avium subsp. paratuberculosis 10-4404]|nr:hypothetical protein O979_08265 [Mycobacterium avium subsp. paratuberculosis 10-4404]